MPKYKQYYQKMIDENKDLFFKFLNIHDKFKADKLKWSDQFNEVGRDVMDVIRDWERRLCSAMGKGQYSSYSHRLADKFKDEVRKDYELIDLVGVKVKKTKMQA